MSTPIKVAICTPHSRAVSPMVTRHIWTLMNQPEVVGRMEFITTEVDSAVVGKARNMIVQAVIPIEPHVYLWIDDDVLMPHFGWRLIDQALEKGIVSGVYVARNTPFTPQLYRRASDSDLPGRVAYWPIFEWEPDETFEVDAVGFGCVAIRSDIFEDMLAYHEPRFKEAADILRENSNGEYNYIAEIIEHLSPWFEFLDAKGEDMYWCERVVEMGHKIWVDPRISCGHIADTPLTQEHFFKLRDAGLIYQDKESGQVVAANYLVEGTTVQGEPLSREEYERLHGEPPDSEEVPS